MAELNLKVTTEVHGADRLRNLAGDIGKVAAGATAALVGIAAFTSGFASDLNESISKVGVVFGENADDIRAWSKSAAKSMGISEQAALESAGTFGNLFTAMDIGQEPAADMSKELVELASDLASFNNIDPAEALEKLRAGIVGEAEPLRTLGVNISAAATEQKALELGIWDGVDALTAAEKAQANYALIMEQTSTAQGDFARTSDGMANQQRTLAATFQDTMAMVGQAFVPIIEAILPQVTAGLQAFGTWVSDNGPAIGNVLSSIASGIGQAFTFITTVAIPALVAGFQWVSTNILPGLVTAFQAVVGWVTENWPTISSIFKQVFGAIESVIKATWPVIEAIATVLFPAIVAAAQVMLSALDGVFKLIGGAFEVLGTVVSAVVDAITAVWREVTAFFRRSVRAFEWIGENIFAPIGEGFEAAIGFIKGIWNAFVRFWNGIQISVPSVEVPFVGSFGGFTVGLPDLPFLAEGGIVTRPTLGVLGEAGPEAIIPLDKMGPTEIHYHAHLTVQGDLEARNTQEAEDALLRVSRFIPVGGQA